MKKRYAIGDRVKIVPGTLYEDQSKGGEGVISSFESKLPDNDSDISDSEYYYRVKWDKGGDNCYRPKDLMSANPKQKGFNIGDRVRLLETSPYWGQSKDSNGTITKLYPTDKLNYQVQWDHGHRDAYSDEDLELADDSVPVSKKFLSKDEVIAAVRERYGNISMTDTFITNFECDGGVKTTDSRQWCYYAGSTEVVLYLAGEGMGGCRIYNHNIQTGETKWARRAKLPEKWQVFANNRNDDGKKVSDWRKKHTSFDHFTGEGYLDETGYYRHTPSYDRATITHDEFMKWVYNPKFKESKPDLWVDPGSEKVWKIVANRDIDREKLSVYGTMPSLKKGAVLWIHETDQLDNIINKSGNVHPFKNKWGANIPAQYFDIHPDNPYPDKPKTSSCGKFKVGDVVTGWHSTGSLMARLESWVIARFTESGNAVPEGHPDKNTNLDSIKHYEPKPKFKVGDTVRAVGQSHGWGQVSYGDIGKITSCSGKQDGEYKYYADFSSHRSWTGYEKCFELVETSSSTGSGVVSIHDQSSTTSDKYIMGVDPYESREKEHPYIKDVEAINAQVVKPKKIKRLTI